MIIGRTEGAVLVADDQGAVVGMLTLTTQEATRYGGMYAEVQELWVEPKNRGKGIGTSLLDAAEQWCRDAGIWPMEIGLPNEGFESFDNTLAFYRHKGYSLIGPRIRKLL